MSATVDTYRLFHEALRDPSAIAKEDLLQLIERYPYSQPLRFALVRRNVLLNEKDFDTATALLYASDATSLYAYAHKPVTFVEEIEVETDDYVGFEEEIAETEETELPISVEDEAASVDASTAPENLETIDSMHDEEVLEKLVHGAGVSADYFVFETNKRENSEIVQGSTDVVPIAEKIDEENISLYNDELMPYSFRWWLHKTRLEHADTYQPFASPTLPKPQQGQFDPQKLDQAILDQQIKENIIHLQDPEAKLSDAAKNKPIQASERKDSKIIERFIREEPIIHPPSPEQLNTENKARQSAEDNYALVTETLANIYVDQGLYLKAIEVFKKLISRYPEKKSYFATRIQEVEKNL